RAGAMTRSSSNGAPMIDWQAVEDKLYAASVNAIEAFAAQHPHERVCFFAFDSEPRYGYVILAFDTAENNLRSVRELGHHAEEFRQRNLTIHDGWKRAKYHLTCPPVFLFNSNSGDFRYAQFTEIKFSEWESAASTQQLP